LNELTLPIHALLLSQSTRKLAARGLAGKKPEKMFSWRKGGHCPPILTYFQPEKGTEPPQIFGPHAAKRRKTPQNASNDPPEDIPKYHFLMATGKKLREIKTI
jgi:hypothetical protein